MVTERHSLSARRAASRKRVVASLRYRSGFRNLSRPHRGLCSIGLPDPAIKSLGYFHSVRFADESHSSFCVNEVGNRHLRHYTQN